MNTQFLDLPETDRKLAFDNAALSMQLNAVVLEKDFWVSWLLGLLFSLPQVAPFLVFKGGTSLSKVFGVIDRFSEDIDLCLVPEFVGADAAGFDALASRVKRDAAVLEMQRLCADKARTVVQPALEDAICAALGQAPAGQWLHYVLDVDAKSPILYFRYPTTQSTGFAYVALELQRTFWEKATILHAEYHRPAGSPTPDRYARHYFDMARLLAHTNAAQFLADVAQCDRVVDWKSRVFARGWARYDLARQGTFRLVPPPDHRADLARDYATMRPMFMSEPPAFDELMAALAAAELTINMGQR